MAMTYLHIAVAWEKMGDVDLLRRANSRIKGCTYRKKKPRGKPRESNQVSPPRKNLSASQIKQQRAALAQSNNPRRNNQMLLQKQMSQRAARTQAPTKTPKAGPSQ